MPELAERQRTVAISLAIVMGVSGVVVFVRSILPVIPGPLLPFLFALVAAALVVVGRRLVRSARVCGARLAAAWAGVAAGLAILGGANAVGLGGGLVVILLIVVFVNTLIALWFRSGLHFAAAQWLGFTWSIIAFVYGVIPLPGVVVAAAGLWWVGAVGFSRAVVVSTTLLLPLTLALSLHPLTHSGLAIDAADISLVAGLTAGAVLLTARVTSSQVYPGVWPAVRYTGVVALSVQTFVAGIPPLAAALAPADPWPGLWWGGALLLGALAVACLSTLRPGSWAVLGWAGLLWATIAVAVAAGPVAASTLALGTLVAVLLITVARQSSMSLGAVLRLAGAAALSSIGLVLLGPPASLAAVVLLAVAAAMIVVTLRPRDARVGILR